ncbi:MAG: histidinol-phosphate transaminase [Oscillospiraceae bacterium]|nr:histidinol-phosphate transaminase [Oscillospiraceae bacterium]
MSRFLKQRYQAMEAYTPGEQPRDMEYIKLNTNEAPFPPAPSVLEAVGKEDIALLRLYSDPTCSALTEKLARLYGVGKENIFLSNGSDDILNFAFMAFGEKGARFPDITYGFYKVFAQLHGVEAEQIPLEEDFSLDYKRYCAGGRLTVIANPNAPTGMSIPVWQIEEILRSDPHRVVVIDEAYVDFGGESCYPLIEKYDNLLVVRTFSKSRCMAGGRLGYAMGSAAIIADLEKLKYATNPYNINRLTQALGEATVDAEDYYRAMCGEIIRVREWTAKALEALGFRVLPSQTNFLFVSHSGIGGKALYLALKQRGILVRHFESQRIRDFNRVTIGDKRQMERFVETVKDILQEAGYENK